MTRLVLLGSLGVAVDCLEWLLTCPDYEVVGVVCSNEPLSAWRRAVHDRNMNDYIQSMSIPRLSLDDLPAVEADLGICVRFHQVLRSQHINSFKQGVINLHGAPLPEMRGSMCDAAALLEGRTSYGTSLHWVNEGIDEGDILQVKRFPIESNHTVYDLFELSNRYGLELIKQCLPLLVSGELEATPQSVAAQALGIEPRTYRVKQVMAMKEVHEDAGADVIHRTARAFQFPGHEPAYLNTEAGRIYVSV